MSQNNTQTDNSAGASRDSISDRGITIDEDHVIQALQLFSRSITDDNSNCNTQSTITVPSTDGETLLQPSGTTHKT